ncbi:hypothetical protein TNCV_1506751 [Trichonephila clavipes]|nr:hypothetical protein TNCV_1506751 [Trichonephila clavipes]
MKIVIEYWVASIESLRSIGIRTRTHNSITQARVRDHDRAVGSLVVTASVSRPEGLGSMPDATKHPPSTHGFTFGVAIYSLRGTSPTKITCMVLKANDRRLAHATMRGSSDYARQVASENNKQHD